MGKKHFDNKKDLLAAMSRKRNDEKIINASYKAFMLLGIMALRDEYGFGTSRLEKWIDKMDDLIDSYDKGYISVQDLSDTIYDETGIRVEV